MGIIPGWLKTAWNDRQERRRIHDHHKAQMKKLELAITQQDITAISETILATEQRESFTIDNYDRLLRLAIATDNLDIFSKIYRLAKSPTPNYKFQGNSTVMPRSDLYFTSYHPLLSTAIESGAAKIALQLARDPQTDIYARSYSEKISYYSEEIHGSLQTESSRNYADSALILAKQKGMNDVAATLAQREAADLTAKAAQLTRRS